MFHRAKIAERNERWFDHVTINRGHWELVLIINLSQNAGLGGTRKPRNPFFFVKPQISPIRVFFPHRLFFESNGVLMVKIRTSYGRVHHGSWFVVS